MLKVSYHAVKGVELQCSLRSIQYAVSIIGLVTITFCVVTVREEGKGETVVTTPDRLDCISCLKQLHVLV
jgi:hypothetical protein